MSLGVGGSGAECFKYLHFGFRCLELHVGA